MSALVRTFCVGMLDGVAFAFVLFAFDCLNPYVYALCSHLTCFASLTPSAVFSGAFFYLTTALEARMGRPFPSVKAV